MKLSQISKEVKCRFWSQNVEELQCRPHTHIYSTHTGKDGRRQRGFQSEGQGLGIKLSLAGGLWFHGYLQKLRRETQITDLYLYIACC